MSFPLSDRLLRDDYLADLGQRPVTELRSMRRECEGAESAVSFARRVLQGRLDIVDDELQRRRDGIAGSADELHRLVEELPRILADDGHARPAGTGPASRPVDLTPDVTAPELLDAIEAAAGIGIMTSLSELSETEVDEVAARLRELERTFSATRRDLHQRIDAVKGELSSRYERGEVSVDALLS